MNTKESKDTLGLTHCVMVAADDALSLRTCLHRPKWAEALGGGGAGSVGAGSGQFSFDLELRFEHDAMVLKQRLKDYPSLQEAEDEVRCPSTNSRPHAQEAAESRSTHVPRARPRLIHSVDSNFPPFLPTYNPDRAR